jgi:hypothetical protein
MKITRSELKKLILESIQTNNSILMEMPEPPIVGQEQTGDYTKEPDGYEGDLAKRSLFHMSQQAQQLHDMLQGDENLEPWVQEKITTASDCLEKAFKAILYDKQNPEGR